MVRRESAIISLAVLFIFFLGMETMLARGFIYFLFWVAYLSIYAMFVVYSIPRYVEERFQRTLFIIMATLGGLLLLILGAVPMEKEYFCRVLIILLLGNAIIFSLSRISPISLVLWFSLEMLIIIMWVSA